jgi:hypothetical protein
MASGHVNRVKRPNTWLHRPMLQNVKKALANSEPSTHAPEPNSIVVARRSALRGRPDLDGLSANANVSPEAPKRSQRTRSREIVDWRTKSSALVAGERYRLSAHLLNVCYRLRSCA